MRLSPETRLPARSTPSRCATARRCSSAPTTKKVWCSRICAGQDGYTLDKILTHDAHTKDTTLHSMLAAMKYPDYPVALGVIRSVEDEIVYDQAVEKQVEEVKAQSKIHCVDDLLHSGATWEI